MIVSHAWYFMDHMVEHIFPFEGEGKIKDYWGNYSAYAAAKKARDKYSSKSDQKKPEKAEKKSGKQSNKPSYKQKKEYESLEKEIEILESDKTLLLEKLNRGDGKPDDLIQWSEEISELMSQIDKKSDRWIELSEIIEPDG